MPRYTVSIPPGMIRDLTAARVAWRQIRVSIPPAMIRDLVTFGSSFNLVFQSLQR